MCCLRTGSTHLKRLQFYCASLIILHTISSPEMIDYSDNHFSTDQLDDLWADLNLNADESTLIIASPRPESIFAASLICRSYLKNGTPFVLTYAEPISDVSHIRDISQTQGTSLTVIVGIELQGSVKEPNHKCIFLGCDLESESSPNCLGSIDCLSPVSHSFANKIGSLDYWHTQLAASTVLAQKWRNLSPSDGSNEIVQAAFDEGILEQRKGLRLFGINRLSAKDVLLYSIYPYLRGLSGSGEACEKLVADANIPLSKRALPMNSLSNDEKEKINEILIRDLPNEVITAMFGEDYVFPRETNKTPVRFMSSFLPLLKTCWSLHKFGMAASVCIGDRSRLLHTLMNSHIEHCKSTTNGFHLLTRFADEGKLDSRADFAVVPDLGINSTALSDVGRIAFDTGLFETHRFLLLESDKNAELVWHSETYALNTILPILEATSLRFRSTSPYSIRLFGEVDASEIIELVQNEIRDTP